MTINQLQARTATLLETWETKRDHRALFLAWYALATDCVHAAICAGRFGDPLWMLRVVSGLADHYFLTVQPECDDRSLVTPAAWRAAHDGPPGGLRRSAAEWLALGVNAQLSNDLPQVIGGALHDDWPLRKPQLALRRESIETFADLMGEAVQCAADALEAGSTCCLALREAAEAWVLDAWTTAMPLATACTEAWWTAIAEEVECAAARRAHLIACAIPGREELLLQGARRLDHTFPSVHDEPECALRDPAPSWGAPTLAGFERFGA
jgi:Family of unknown function (DUF5995)